MLSSVWRNNPCWPVSWNLSKMLQIDRDWIERYGGDPSVCDLGLLQSVVAARGGERARSAEG